MAVVAEFTFNPFQENTYILYDDTKDCVIIDPGCYTASEQNQLSEFIEAAELKPVLCLNTHCHLDHVFGNAYVMNKYGIGLAIHKGELPVLAAVPEVCKMYGVPNVDRSPDPTQFLDAREQVKFGETTLEVLFTPGHSPASISFFSRKDGFVLGGDVLFQNSIGRTDLPGGDFPTLIRSIKEQFFPLGDEVKVYSGHGPATTIGAERTGNQFLI